MATLNHQEIPRPRHYDMPFVYAFDAQGLTDGQDYDYLSIPVIPDSDFLLRRVTSTPTVVEAAGFGGTGRVQLWTELGAKYFSRPQLLMGNYPVVPQTKYSAGSQIRFDLENVMRAKNTGGGETFYWSQLCFQGVRRYYGTQAMDTPYPYYEKPQSYSQVFDIDYNGNSQLVQYVQPINEFDFTLHGISISTVSGSSGELPTPGVWQPVIGGMFLMYLYDKNQQRLSNIPIDAAVLAMNSVDNAACTGEGVFPCPPLLYPVGSQIVWDVKSLQLTSFLPISVQITFHGIWRLPCR